MRRILSGSAFLLIVLAFALQASGEDQQKARKEINKVTAMATDLTGRLMVNLSMADMFKMKRQELVNARMAAGLNYGSIFVAQELMASGGKLTDIEAQLKSGRSIYQIAAALQADWKKIASDAKILNRKIDDNLCRHFSGTASEKERDRGDPYTVAADGVEADRDVSADDLGDARDRYLFLRQRARAASDNRLDDSKEMAARENIGDVRDHARQVDNIHLPGH